MGRSISLPNDGPGRRPETLEEIASHNARILAQQEEAVYPWMKNINPFGPQPRAKRRR